MQYSLNKSLKCILPFLKNSQFKIRDIFNIVKNPNILSCKLFIRLVVVFFHVVIYGIISPYAVSQNNQIVFEIIRQPADTALKSFAKQAEIQLLYPYDTAKKYITNPVHGIYDINTALDILLKNSGLSAVFSESGYLIIQVDESSDIRQSEETKNINANIDHEELNKDSQEFSSEKLYLEEIVVTAQRREQSLQDVPISLEVISGENIIQQGYEDLTSLQSFTPNLYLESNARNSDIMIRGVGTLGSNLGFEQAVPVFADGVHYGRGSQITNAFLDIERVEVLRGPQPVFFGQNATAGAISLTTRKPGMEWEGYINTEYGNDDRKVVELAYGGPITDSLGIRVAGKYLATDGHLKNVWAGNKFPQRESYVGRILLQWHPSEELQVLAKLEYMDLKLGGRDVGFFLTGPGVVSCAVDSGMCAAEDPAAFGILPAYSIPAGGKFTEYGTVNGPPFWEIRPEYGIKRGNRAQANLLPLIENPPSDLDLGRSDLDFSPREDIKPFVGVIDADYTFANGVALSSQTAYSYFDRFARVTHTDNGPFATRKLDGWEEMDQYTQEFRLTSPTGGFMEWMGGVYGQLQNLDTHYVNLFARIERGGSFKEAISSQDSTWLSGFVTLVFNMTEEISADFGVRYTDVHKTGNIIPYEAEWICAGGDLCLDDPVGNLGTTPIGMSPILRQFPDHVNGEYDTNDINWQMSLRWRPTEEVSLFGKYANAFKAGGFDFGKTFFSAAHAQESQFEFRDEAVWSTEFGAKASLLNGRGNVELTVFYSEFKDLQRSAFDVIEEVNRVTNAAKQSVRGVEGRGSLLIGDRWQVNVSGAMLNGKMDSFPGATCTQIEIDQDLCLDSDGNPDSRGTIDRTGQEAVRSPDWSIMLGSNYWYPVWGDYKASVNTQISFSDSFILNDTASRVVDMPRHVDLNLTLGFGPEDEAWTLSLFGRHLTRPVPQYNPEFDTAPSGLATADISASMIPSYGVKFRYKFQ